MNDPKREAGVTTERHDRVLILRLGANLLDKDDLDQWVDEQDWVGLRCVVINLANVRRVNVPGIGIFMHAFQRLDRMGLRVNLCCRSEVLRGLNLVWFPESSFYETELDAIAGCAGRAVIDAAAGRSLSSIENGPAGNLESRRVASAIAAPGPRAWKSLYLIRWFVWRMAGDFKRAMVALPAGRMKGLCRRCSRGAPRLAGAMCDR